MFSNSVPVAKGKDNKTHMTERNTCNCHLVALQTLLCSSGIQLVPVHKCPERVLHYISYLLFYGIHVCLKSEEKNATYLV